MKSSRNSSSWIIHPRRIILPLLEISEGPEVCRMREPQRWGRGIFGWFIQEGRNLRPAR
jgi:hypothetical protein